MYAITYVREEKHVYDLEKINIFNIHKCYSKVFQQNFYQSTIHKKCVHAFCALKV